MEGRWKRKRKETGKLRCRVDDNVRSVPSARWESTTRCHPPPPRPSILPRRRDQLEVREERRELPQWGEKVSGRVFSWQAGRLAVPRTWKRSSVEFGVEEEQGGGEFGEGDCA